MKKYLQACELGGSIYGKKKNSAEKDSDGTAKNLKEDSITAYRKFFKNQLVNMDRVYRREH